MRWPACADEVIRRDVADEIEIQLVIERRVDRARPARVEERLVIRSRTSDRLGGDIGPGASNVNTTWK